MASKVSTSLKSGISKVATPLLKPFYALLRNKLGVSKFFAAVIVVYLLMPGVVLDLPPTNSGGFAPLGFLGWVDPLGLIPANNVSALVHSFIIVTLLTGFLASRH